MNCKSTAQFVIIGLLLLCMTMPGIFYKMGSLQIKDHRSQDVLNEVISYRNSLNKTFATVLDNNVRYS